MTAIRTEWKALSRAAMAKRVAYDIREGWLVNLGIGIPTEVANAVPQSREVIFHSENGIIGVGSEQVGEPHDPWMVNAGKQFVTLRQGGCFIHHADSFAIIRGGHLDLSILGAFEVSEGGDIANWATSNAEAAPAVGGAMDLAAGAKRVWVIMEHTTKSGNPRLVRQCSYPLTACKVVTRIYTNLAVLNVTPGGFQVVDKVADISDSELQNVTEAQLTFT